MTAVDWFKEMIFPMIHSYDESELEDFYQQAIEMEKQQIIDAYLKNPQGYNHTGEQYYNETFKSQ